MKETEQKLNAPLQSDRHGGSEISGSPLRPHSNPVAEVVPDPWGPLPGAPLTKDKALSSLQELSAETAKAEPGFGIKEPQGRGVLFLREDPCTWWDLS